MPDAAPTTDDRAALVGLLQTAAQIEHCLMLSYLYAAASLRSTPQEFETLPTGRPNPRRAVQFELVRRWKQMILTDTAVEEMLHLHFVQCLLRALGEPPCFTLPDRDSTGAWVIPDWTIADPEKPVPSQGAFIALGPVSEAQLQAFIAYESTDSLQEQDLKGPVLGRMFAGLCNWELDLHLECILLNADDTQRAKLKSTLAAIYLSRSESVITHPVASVFRFQSINDLYRNRIQPLYQKAFEQCWVKNSNLMLNNELFDPNYAGQVGGRMVPTGPVQRNQRFGRLISKTTDDPIRNFSRVGDMIDVILGQGEGVLKFQERATKLLDTWLNEGTRRYAQGLALAIPSGGAKTPGWMAEFELVRQSHIYRFAMVLNEMWEEQARASDPTFFTPNREQLDAGSWPELQQTAKELPEQLNACYLVVIVWMSRIYEVQNWAPDKERRAAIEMLAAWPLMSMAMRPLLELLSFFPVDRTQVFRMEPAAGSPEAQELIELYRQASRTEEENARMDEDATAVLAQIAEWSRRQQDAVRRAAVPPHARQMVLTRLESLAQLGEFQEQFRYRAAGGYSDRLPSLDYQQRFPDSARFEEDPFQHKPPSQKPQDTTTEFPVFSDTLVLRLRFSGWALAQLATDPDTARDEAGCSGTTFFHAADGNRRLNRAIVWQPDDRDDIILREPRDRLPEIGVTCQEISLMAAAGEAQVGYVPLPTQQLPGSLSNSPAISSMEVDGLLPVLRIPAGQILGAGRKIRVDLKEKNGVKPTYCGLNHLVWQDGEPIDPFILSMTVDPPLELAEAPQPCPQRQEAPVRGQARQGRPALLLQREVYNGNLSFMEMTPLERLLTSRGPCGKEPGLTSVPDWALPPQDRQKMQNPPAFLKERAEVLLEALCSRLASSQGSQEDVDEVISLAERLGQITTPQLTTQRWLSFLLHYGHTLSGDISVGEGLNEVFSAFAARTGLQLGITFTGARYVPNSRWLVKYGCAAMDVDALSNLVYGELFVPVTITQAPGPVTLAEQWTFPAGFQDALAAFACQFSKPFWADYQVDGNTRTWASAGLTIVETLEPAATIPSYRYSLSGLAGVTSCNCQFATAVTDTGTSLTWNVSLSCSDPASALHAVCFLTGAAGKMKSALIKHFQPAAANR